MSKKIINSKNAPAPIGPYSQAVQTGNLLFVSGQIAIDPSTGQLKTASIEEQAKQVMENLKAVLAEAGLNFSHIIKTTIFLTSMSDFDAVNKVYGSYFTDNFPARETVAVAGLPKNVNVEISVIASGN
ncbi:MAG: RutC family protein [Bacteroidetes bacterium ADurb.Bin141]|nr:MAG: endoribonuclease L-PSP [Bacteroidetes bacterium OLB10]MBX3105173.1 RidA family protein [Bacteroidota bacterium]MCB8930046.1 RidA family protein [Bacteroidia bacterium]OQB65816.1 MAG: RutC family protein [Bacteroidetes bacterium ADurb.Bin141]MCB0849422.1 RidA family protein [Bacteroidota bacterium]